MSEQKITVPNIGDFKEVEVIEVLVKEGQTIKKNDSVITLESDKSSVEVPSDYEGEIKKINTKVGDKVSEGSIILLIKTNENSQPKDMSSNSVPKEEEKNGRIELINSRNDYNISKDIEGSAFATSIRVSPKEGYMIVFPSSLLHTVHPNTSNEDRISIAWNILLVKKN